MRRPIKFRALGLAGRRSLSTACAAAGVLLLSACGDGGEQGGPGGPGGPWGNEGEAPIPAVEVVQARLDALPLRERLTGTVQAAGQVAIYPQTSGPITAVYVDDGTVVQEGQPLVRIESRSPRSQLEQAEASLSVAQAEARAARASLAELESQFRRTQLLAEDSLVSQETVETEQAQVEAARAAVQQADAGVRSARAAIQDRAEAVSRTIVRAPISGVVGQRAAEVGMIADGQSPLFIIGRLDRMRVEVPIAQDLIGRVVTGQRVEIRTDAMPGDPIVAEISRLSPFLAQGTFSAEAEIDVENPAGRLVPGMFVTADVYYGESDSTTVVPVSALYDDVETNRAGVYVATVPDSGGVMTVSNDGTGTLTQPTETRFVPVEVIAEGRQTVGITGVRPGEWVVVIGQNLLAEEPTATPVARIRPSSWERIIRLQEMQGPELLQEVMEEHRRMSTPSEPTSSATSGPNRSSDARGE